MTLLLAFFTTMYAASSVDARKLETMVEAMQKAFDTDVTVPTRIAGTHPASLPTDGPQPARRAAARDVDAMSTERPVPIDAERYEVMPIPVGTSGRVPTAVSVVAGAAAEVGPWPNDQTLSHVLARLSEQLAEEIVRGAVTLEMDRRGLVVSVRESASFETGSAELSADAQQLMARLAEPLAGIPNPVRVEGHTDDVPIHTTRYGSNWELSTTRAVNVVAFLVEDMSLEPTRLSAAGYSEFHPRFANDSAFNRARNRRVDLVILDPEISHAEEPLRLEGLDD